MYLPLTPLHVQHVVALALGGVVPVGLNAARATYSHADLSGCGSGGSRKPYRR